MVVGCGVNETKSAVHSFQTFLKFFPLVEKSEYSIDEKLISNHSRNTVKLDSALISNYIMKDSLIISNLYLFQLYKFSSVVRFNISPNLVGIIYRREGGAGGVEVEYFFNVYSSEGDLLSSLLFAEMKSDCSFYNIQEGNLNGKKILTNVKIYDTDCLSDKLKLRKIIKKKYEIQTNGGIVEKVY